MENFPYLMALAAGIVSFLSPCVLPLVPGYISFISGVSFDRLNAAQNSGGIDPGVRKRAVIAACMFVTGFGIVFIALGASATWIGSYLNMRLPFLTKAAGVFLIGIGLFKMGILRWMPLYRQINFSTNRLSGGYLTALLVGAAFAFGWTPCVGPILAGILVYAGTLTMVHQGIGLLVAYTLGLGIPFILTALGVHRVLGVIKRFSKYLGILEKGVGLVLILFGVLIFTDSMTSLSASLFFLNRFAL